MPDPRDVPLLDVVRQQWATAGPRPAKPAPRPVDDAAVAAILATVIADSMEKAAGYRFRSRREVIAARFDRSAADRRRRFRDEARRQLEAQIAEQMRER